MRNKVGNERPGREVESDTLLRTTKQYFRTYTHTEPDALTLRKSPFSLHFPNHFPAILLHRPNFSKSDGTPSAGSSEKAPVFSHPPPKNTARREQFVREGEFVELANPIPGPQP